MPGLDPRPHRITLRPRVFDRIGVVGLLLPGLFAVTMIIADLRGVPPNRIHCTRTTATCIISGPRSMLSTSTPSSLVAMDQLWLADDYTKQFRAMSDDYRAFVADPARATFDAAWQGIKPMPLPGAIALAGVCLFFALRWWRGWNAELEIDPSERTVTIRRRPMFFTGPRTLTRPATELRLVEAVENRYVGRGQRAKFVHFELRDAASGKRVFKYLALYDKKTRAQLDADMALLAQHVQSS